MCVCNAIAERMNPNSFSVAAEYQVLPDPLLKLSSMALQQTKVPLALNDILMNLCVTVTVLRVFNVGDQSLTALRRFFLVGGCVELLRGFTIVMTVLPNPFQNCRPVHFGNVFSDAFDMLVGRRISCGDVFYSGHAAIYTLLAALWVRFVNPGSMRTIFLCFVSLCTAFLIFSSYHYTVDVFIAVLISSTAWVMFHFFIEIDELRITPVGIALVFADGQLSSKDLSCDVYDDEYVACSASERIPEIVVTEKVSLGTKETIESFYVPFSQILAIPEA